MTIDILKIDEHVQFLRDQISRLEDLTARPGNSWANRNIRKMEEIIETLMELRREKQMTMMSGKPIE